MERPKQQQQQPKQELPKQQQQRTEQQQQPDEQQEELPQLGLYMELEEMPPRSFSLKKGRDEEEEEDLKFSKRERKCGRSKVDKALVDAKTQSAPASPARS